MQRPKTKAEFMVTAFEMADSGKFASADDVAAALSCWILETEIWWTVALKEAVTLRIAQTEHHRRRG